MKSSQNPILFMQNALMQNPQLQNAIDYVNSNGGNPQQAFYKLAQQKGINPDEVLNLFK